MRLRDKVIAITGAGSGLGRECALRFAAEGAQIITSDIVPGRADNVAKEVEAAGGHAVGVDADVRSEPDIERLVATTLDTFGRIDVMFANAGIPEPGFGAGRLEDLTLDEWNNVLATNLTGIFLAFKHAARAMIARGEGGTLLATTIRLRLPRLHRLSRLRRQQGRRERLHPWRVTGVGEARDPSERAVPDPRHVDQLRHAARGRRPREVLRGNGALGSEQSGHAAQARPPADPA